MNIQMRMVRNLLNREYKTKSAFVLFGKKQYLCSTIRLIRPIGFVRPITHY